MDGLRRKEEIIRENAFKQKNKNKCPHLIFGSVLETKASWPHGNTHHKIIKLEKSIKRKGAHQVTHTTVLLMLMSHSQPLDKEEQQKI